MTKQTPAGEVTEYDVKTNSWVPAEEVPYYPSWWERLLHFFGVHQWTIGGEPRCVMCGKVKNHAGR